MLGSTHGKVLFTVRYYLVSLPLAMKLRAVETGSVPRPVGPQAVLGTCWQQAFRKVGQPVVRAFAGVGG